MNFLNGIYGLDLFSLFLLLISSIFSIFEVTSLLSLLISIFALYRVFSKKVYKRREEYNLFFNYLNKFLSRFGKSLPYNMNTYKFDNIHFYYENMKKYISNRKKFKIVKCSICKQKLRLPRGKGNLLVYCKKCGHKFDLKT